jgi:hypothetical protein
VKSVPIIVAVLALTATPALAGGHQGGGGGSATSSTLQLVPLSPTPGAPYFGDQVTFNVSTTATTQPWVTATCSQNGVVVYQQTQGFFPTYLYGQIFTLGPTPMWTGGAADCKAALVQRTSNGRSKTLATITFHVAA